MPPTPKLVRRGIALAILAPYGITRHTFNKWRENQTIRPVEIPGFKQERYRTSDILRLVEEIRKLEN